MRRNSEWKLDWISIMQRDNESIDVNRNDHK